TRSKDVVTIYFNNNYNCSLDELVFPVVPSTQYASIAQFNSAVDFKPVGTGQYEYKSYNKLKQLRLVPFEDYYGHAAKKNITVTIIPDEELAPNMMEINSVSCYVDDAANRKSIATDKKLKVYDFPSNDVEFMVFNTYDPVLSHKDIRHAVAYGINTEKILNNAYMGDGILSDTIYYPDFLGVKDTGKYYSFDINKAKSMIEQAGYADVNGDGFVEDVLNEQIVFDILVNEKNATRNSAARLIKSDLEQLGIRANIMSLPQNEYLQAIRNKNFDILLTGYTIEENYDLRSFYNGKNEWGYSNYDLQMLSRELDRLYSPEDYKAKYAELKELLMDELPYYSLCYKKMSLIGLPTFEAEELPMFNNIYMNCDKWSWSIVKEKNNSEE
ncbi:MAG: ABC transporter substrate-binding protein, partial [Firmicutes bacterium]|nr:ABC transporter substrate-binding protein [Bacillota bacterium]